MSSVAGILGSGKAKDIFGTLSPSLLAAGVIHLYIFPELPSLDTLFMLSFLAVIFTAILTALSPFILRTVVNKDHFINETLKQGEFEKLRQGMKNVLRKQNHSIIENISNTYKEIIKKNFDYEMEKIELDRHLGENKKVYEALNLKEVKILNFASILIVSAFLTGIYCINHIFPFIQSLNPEFINLAIDSILQFIFGGLYESISTLFSTEGVDPLVLVIRSILPLISIPITIILFFGIRNERKKYQTLYISQFSFITPKHLPPINEINFEVESLNIFAKDKTIETAEKNIRNRIASLDSMKEEVLRVQTRRRILLREVEAELRELFNKNLNNEENSYVKKALERTYVAIAGDIIANPRDLIRTADSNQIKEGIVIWMEQKHHEALLENLIAVDISDFARKSIIIALADDKIRYTPEITQDLIRRLRESMNPELEQTFIEWIIVLGEDRTFGDEIWKLVRQDFFREIPVEILIRGIFRINPTSLHNGTLMSEGKFQLLMSEFITRFESYDSAFSVLIDLWIPKEKHEDNTWLKERINGTHTAIEQILRQQREKIESYQWLFKAVYIINELINEEPISRNSSSNLLSILTQNYGEEIHNLCFKTLPFLKWHHTDQLGNLIKSKFANGSIGFLENLVLMFLNPVHLKDKFTFENLLEDIFLWNDYLRRPENALIRWTKGFDMRGHLNSSLSQNYMQNQGIEQKYANILLIVSGLAMDSNDLWQQLNQIWNTKSNFSPQTISYLYLAYAYLGRGDKTRRPDVIAFFQNHADSSLMQEDSPSIQELRSYIQQGEE